MNSHTSPWVDLIRSLIGEVREFSPQCENEQAVQVERSEVLALRLLRPGADTAGHTARLVELGKTGRLEQVQVVDGRGHQRPEYLPILVYAWARACPGEPAIAPWSRPLTRAIALAANLELRSVNGAAVARGAWSALAMQAISREEPAGGELLGRIVASQQASGALLASTPRDNPETHWYHELVILHALASHAAMSGRSLAAMATARAAEFHLNHTQPDHATMEPFGVHAFLADRRRAIIGEGMLHAVRAEHPRGARGMTAMLLADAAEWLTAT